MMSTQRSPFHVVRAFCNLAALAALSAAVASAEDFEFKLVPTGANAKVGFYVPQRITMSAEKPASIKKLPADLASPVFGELKVGPKGSTTTIAIVIDERPDGAEKLYLDANANGDLSDDPPAKWDLRHYKTKEGAELNQFSGGGSVEVRYGEKPATLGFKMYHFDKNDAGRAAFKNILFYYGDYARQGQIKLGDKTFSAILHDRMSGGDFGSKATSSAVNLLIDVNGDGKFDMRNELFSLGEPFNIGGVTYELASVSASGDKLTIQKSDKTVAEKRVSPTLGAGKKALAFKADTTGGDHVDFPSSYKGKLVMLDFWATWCGPCVGELPHLTAAYEKYHAKGFEVLGISLDQANAAQKLASFTKDKKMPWPQVYDGKYWSAEVAQLYDIHSIPSAFLVDGDTGQIVANGNSLRGEELDRTLGAALEKKAK